MKLWGIRLFLAGLVFWAVGQTVWTVYGHSDDYPLLFQSQQETIAPLANFFTHLGRLLLGSIYQVALGPESTLVTLGWFRLVAIVGMVLLAWRIHDWLRREDVDQAWLIALVASVTPGLVVATSWASAAQYTLAACLAFEAGRLVLPPGSVGLLARPALRILAGTLMVAVSCSLYQPTAAFVLLPLALAALYRQRLPSLWEGMRVGLVFIPGVLIWFVSWRLAMAALFERTVTGRTAISLDPLVWLERFGESLQVGLSGWGILWVGPAAGVSAALTVVGVLALLFCWWPTGWRALLWRLGVFVAILPLTLFASLAAEGADVTLRTLCAFHSFLAVVAVVPLIWLGQSRFSFGARIVSVTVAVGLALMVHFQVRVQLIEPQLREWEVIQSAFAESSVPPRAVGVIPPTLHQPPGEGLAGWVRARDHFGIYSSSLIWNSPAMVRLALREAGMSLEELPAVRVVHFTFLPSRTEATIDGYVWIDLSDRLQTDAPPVLPESSEDWPWEEDAYWGPMQRGPDRWRHVPWFGTFLQIDMVRIHHPSLGSVYLAGSGIEGNTFSLFDHGLGHWLTTPSSFPAMLRRDDQTWYRLDVDSGPLRLRFVAGDGTELFLP